MNLGELFVKLGFKVDDKDLHRFNSGMQNALQTAMKLTGVTLSLAGFRELLSGAAKGATALDNLSLKFGIATNRAQGFVNAMMKANPNMTREAAGGAYNSLATYASMLQIRGAGRGRLFGITGEDNSPEKVMEKLRSNFDRVEKQWGRGTAVEIVREIMGTDDALNAVLMTTREFQEATKKGIIDEESIENLKDYNQAVQELGIQFDQLKAKYLAMPAKEISNFLKGGFKEPKKYNSMKEYIDNEGWGGFLWDSFKKGLPMLGSGAKIAGGTITSGAQTIVGGKGAGKEMAQSVLGEFGYGMQNNASPAPTASANDRQEFARKYFESMGWTPSQAQGMVTRLAKESGANLDTTAVGDGGKAVGIAQWHPDRQLDFFKFMGKEVMQATLQEQLAFVNYELTKGKERRAGDLLKRTQNSMESYGIFTNEYERPAAQHRAPMSVIQHIYSNGDVTQVANQTLRAFQQADLGAQY